MFGWNLLNQGLGNIKLNNMDYRMTSKLFSSPFTIVIISNPNTPQTSVSFSL